MADEHEEQITDLSRSRSRVARENRADFLEEERASRARDLAVEEALRRERVDSRLASHDTQLAAMNTTIANLQALIQQLNLKLDEVSAQLATQNAVDADRVAQFKKANENQISTRMFLLGVVAIMATIFGAFLSSGHFG